MNRRSVIITILLIIMVALYIVKSKMEIETFELNISLDAIQKEEEKLQGENALLRQQVLEQQSLQYLDRKAKEQGFIPLDSRDMIMVGQSGN